MPKKKQVQLAQMKLGIFVIIAFILLSLLILQQSWGINWFSDSTKIITYLTDVGGLKPGSPVWLAGMEIGKVRRISLIPPESYPENTAILGQIEKIKKRIEALDAKIPSDLQIAENLQNDIRNLQENLRLVEVKMDIRMQYLDRIGPDSDVSIASRGLIGDSFIDISPGISKELPPRTGEYYFIQSIQQPGFREIMTGANDVIANFGVLSKRVQDIAERIIPENIGTDISDTVHALHETISAAEKAFSRATVLIDELHSGQGTFGKIVSDPTVYTRLTEALEKFSAIAENIQNGDGTVSKLIHDPALYDSARSAVGKTETIVGRMEKGEGTLGKLSTDEALYERSRRALESFASLVEEIEQGQGTLGKLLKDPGLYNNLEQSSSEISKLLYDLRQDPRKYMTIRVRLF
ncbi:MAG: MCE family protein [Acidobacteria bacterium]|nr:MCE family protein [Acidobacteriota bacterium]